jgi:hypothetical protein
MTVAAAFMTVAGLGAFLLITVFLAYRFRYVLRKGYFRVEFICDDGDIITRTFRLKGSDSEFSMLVKGKKDTYHILAEEGRVYHTGRFRIPKAYYIAHRAEPIDMKKLKLESKVSATKYNELAKNTVTSQLLNAFTENPMKEAMAIIMAVAIIMGGILILGYYMNSRINEIMDKLQ